MVVRLVDFETGRIRRVKESRFAEEQIIGVLRDGDAGGKTSAIWRRGAFGDDVLLFLSANRAEATITGAQYVHWETMKYLEKHGYVQYDLGGLPPNDDRIGHFKRSLGGRVISLASEYVWRPRVV